MKLEEIADQHGREGERHLHEGRFTEALSAFQAALKIAQESQDKAAESLWLANCGVAHLAAGENREAQTCLEQALKSVIELGRPDDEMHIRRDLAIACFEQRNPETALANVTAALKIAREKGSRRDEAEFLGYLGIVCSMMGEYQSASEHYQEAILIAYESNDRAQIGVLTGNLGNNFLGLEEYQQAIQKFEEALRIAHEVGDHINEEKWQSGLAAAQRHLEREKDPSLAARYDYQVALQAHQSVDPEQAVQLWLRSARSCRVARDYLHCGDSLTNAGLILNQLQRFHEADRRFEEAMDAFRAVNDQRRIGLLCLNQAVSLRDRGEPDRASDMFKQAIDLLRGAKAPAELAHALTSLASLHSERKENEQNIVLLKQAEKIYRDMNSESELAELLIRLGSSVTENDQAERLLRESAELARKAKAFKTLTLAKMVLASHLVEQARNADAIRELTDMKAHVLKEASSKLSRQYLLLLGQLLNGDNQKAEAFDVWHELLEIADRDGDLESAVHALGNICTAYASELRAIRNRMNERLGRSASEVANHAQSLLPDTVPLTVETEDDAIQMVRSLMQAGNQEATDSLVPDGVRQLEQVIGRELAGSSTHRMAGIIQLRATEFNQVFFESLTFNVEHAISQSDMDRARALVELARFIASVQTQALQISSTLLNQMVEEDQTEIIHLGSGDHFSPVAGKDALNRRVSEELYREALQHLAAQRFKPAYERFENALELLKHLGEDTAECLGNLAYCASEMGQFDVADEYAREAIARFREMGNKGQEAKTLLIIGGIQLESGTLEKAIQTYEEVLTLARDANESAIEASAMSNIGAVFQRQGDTRRALEWQERSLALKRTHAGSRSLAATLGNLAILYRDTGEVEKSDAMLGEAREIIEATGHRSQLVAFLNNMGSYAIKSGRPADAESSLHHAREIAIQIGNPLLEARVLENLVIALREQGKWSPLDETLSVYEEIQRQTGSELGIAKALMLRVDADIIRGKYESAITACTKLQNEFWEQLSLVQMISVLANLRDCNAATGRRGEAASCAKKLREIIAINTMEGTEANPKVFLLCSRAYARLASEGDADEDRALQLLSRSMQLGQHEGLTNEVIELLELQASIYRRQGRLHDSIESHKQALALIGHSQNEYRRAVAITNLATALRQVGQLQDSMQAFQEALSVARQVDAKGLQALILQKAATVMHDLGRRDDVGSLAREAIELARQSGDRVTEARAKITLAGCLMESENAAAAERELRTILEDDEYLPPDTRAEACAVCALALRAQQRYDEAIKLINDALTLGGGATIDRATYFFYAGLIHLDNSRWKDALEKLDIALQLIGEDAVSPLTLNIRQARGDIHRKRGDLPSATREYEWAARDLRLLRKRVLHERDRIQGLADFATISQKLTYVLLSQQRFTEAFAALEEAKSRSFVERLGLGDLPVPEAVPNNLRKREHELRNEILQLQRSVMHAESARQRRRASADYSRVVNEHDQLLEKIAGYAPDYVEWRRGATITFEGVREILRS
jgi:tetratricopeptide (TPR) repeat protein